MKLFFFFLSGAKVLDFHVNDIIFAAVVCVVTNHLLRPNQNLVNVVGENTDHGKVA
jgi:hypothetical protein